MLEVESARVIPLGDGSISGFGIGRKRCAVDRHEGDGCRKRSASIAIDERTVLGQAFPESGRLFDDILAVAGLGSFVDKGLDRTTL